MGGAGLRHRYAHADCYIKAKENGTETATYEIWDPATSTTCFWCHKPIFPKQDNVMPMPQIPNRYVHKKCNEEYPKTDLEKLTLYIIQLFQLKDDYILPRYMKQISSYIKNYNFSYSGMLKALKYWYEIKKHPIDLDRGVGIIPYVYKQAYDYYLALYLAEQENSKKNFNDYIPEDIEVKIIPPERKLQKRKLFVFLDQEDINE